MLDSECLNDLSFVLDSLEIIQGRMKANIISHHYEEADYEVLFDICQNHLPDLEKTVIQKYGLLRLIFVEGKLS